MKYLLLLVVVFAVLWWLRRGARQAGRSADAPRPPADAQPMVSCTHCNLHLPRREAVLGADGAYCSEAHRLAHGDGPPR